MPAPNNTKTAPQSWHILSVEGMHCAACAAKVEKALQEEGATQAHVDLLSGKASFRAETTSLEPFVQKISSIGYKAGAQKKKDEDDSFVRQEERALALRAIFTGFAYALVLLLQQQAPEPVRLIASISFLTLFYAGWPFLKNAAQKLFRFQSDMDIPIAFALLLPAGLSLWNIYQQHGPLHFEAELMLLFALLLGRYLEAKARGRARDAAQMLAATIERTATIIEKGEKKIIASEALRAGMLLSVLPGEKISGDGHVEDGSSLIDAAMVTGESLPLEAEKGTEIYAGMVNLTAPLSIRLSKDADQTLVQDMVRLIQAAKQKSSRFVRLADRVASYYMPFVLILFVASFLGWRLWGGKETQDALLIASSVLLIACPCALGLAVPAVQTLASARLFKKGVFLKSGDALEKIAHVQHIVFDKTGTLTLGRFSLVNGLEIPEEEMKVAASLARHSNHPLSKALVAAYERDDFYPLTDIEEEKGQGLFARKDGEEIYLGRREWCGPKSFNEDDFSEIWVRYGFKPPRRFVFEDAPRSDAKEIIRKLSETYVLHLFSGDRETLVSHMGKELSIPDARGALLPTEKVALIEQIKKEGGSVAMIGDGLNDAAALSMADVSLSPSSALDITQNVADIVFQGEELAPLLDILHVAKRNHALVKQNILLALLYNATAIPVALAGLVSPALAALAMSFSSITVVLNAQRIRKN